MESPLGVLSGIIALGFRMSQALVRDIQRDIKGAFGLLFL